MKELIVNDKKRILLDKDDKCPICDTPRNKMCFTWRMFHGEADSSCCGAVYQIKDYYIENPNDEEKELLKLLRGEYIEFAIKPDLIIPLKQALKDSGERNISSEKVIDLVKHLL